MHDEQHPPDRGGHAGRRDRRPGQQPRRQRRRGERLRRGRARPAPSGAGADPLRRPCRAARGAASAAAGWAATVERMRATPGIEHRRSNDEWSAVQTLRHLVFVHDSWFRRCVLGSTDLFTPMGLGIDFVPDQRGAGARPRRPTPTLDEVLAVRDRAGRRARGLAGRRSPPSTCRRRRRCPTAPAGRRTPAAGRSPQCLRTVLDEEWAHHGFCVRDLDRWPATGSTGGTLARVDRVSEMTYRPLGDSGLMVSAVGIGCNAFGRRVDLDGVRDILDAAQDVGVTLLDTADVYGGTGASEEMLGEALQGRRDEFVVATKFGMDMRGANGADHGARGSRALRTPGGRGVAAAAADRPHRPLPVPRARRGHPDRGDAVGADRPGPRGQGPLRRLLQRRGLAGRRRRLDRPYRRASSASSRCRTATPCSTARSRRRWCRPASSSGSGVLPYFPLEYGLLTGKYHRGQDAPGRLARRGRRRRRGSSTPTGTGSRRSRSTPRRAASRCSTSPIAGLAAQPAVGVGDRRRDLAATRCAPTPRRCAGSRRGRPRRARRDHPQVISPRRPTDRANQHVKTCATAGMNMSQ